MQSINMLCSKVIHHPPPSLSQSNYTQNYPIILALILDLDVKKEVTAAAAAAAAAAAGAAAAAAEEEEEEKRRPPMEVMH